MMFKMVYFEKNNIKMLYICINLRIFPDLFVHKFNKNVIH